MNVACAIRTFCMFCFCHEGLYPPARGTVSKEFFQSLRTTVPNQSRNVLERAKLAPRVTRRLKGTCNTVLFVLQQHLSSCRLCVCWMWEEDDVEAVCFSVVSGNRQKKALKICDCDKKNHVSDNSLKYLLTVWDLGCIKCQRTSSYAVYLSNYHHCNII